MSLMCAANCANGAMAVCDVDADCAAGQTCMVRGGGGAAGRCVAAGAADAGGE
jgi:hypothetical protein